MICVPKAQIWVFLVCWHIPTNCKKNSWLKVYISLEKFNVFTFSYVDHTLINCWYNHKYMLIIILLMLIIKSKEYITFWCFKTDVVTDSSNRDRGPNLIWMPKKWPWVFLISINTFALLRLMINYIFYSIFSCAIIFS